ncbi:MAG: glycosyltransferase, partial [Chloroflexi bacterium]|nr:glycosyltransferase [Chloroflexota bacterium]
MVSQPINVLRVVIGLNQGGVQQGVLNLCRGLDSSQFKVLACAIENGGAIAREIEEAGSEVIVLGYKRQPVKTILALIRLMRDRDVRIVHASSYHPSLYARIAGILAGVPVRMSYEHVVFDNRRPVRIFLNRLLSGFTQAFTAVGESVAVQVKDWYGYSNSKVYVVHNGVDIKRFQ